MKSSLKRFLSLALALVLVVGLTACGGKKEESETSAPAESTETSTPAESTEESSEATSDADVEKPEKIVLMGSTIIMDPENGQQEIADKYEELTGIKLEFIKPAHNQYQEKVDLAFASGDLPDILENIQKFTSYASNGALWDATDTFYASELSERVDHVAVDTLKLGGRLYGVPTTKGNGTVTYVRGDWLEKLDLDVPTNYDEFYDMLVAFRDNDPDGNGQDDTIPFTCPGLMDFRYYNDFLTGPLTQADFFVKDGEVVEGLYTEEMKLGLERLQTAYAEGLIDQEAITNKTSTCRDKYYTGNVGVFTYWAGTWNKTLQSNLEKTIPEGVTQPIPPLEGTYLVDRVAPALIIPAANENPEGIFKYLIETMFDGGEGQMLWVHGVENVHWEEKDGNIEKMPDGLDPSTKFIKAAFAPELAIYDWEDPIELDPDIVPSLDLFNEVAIGMPLVPVSEDITGLVAELKTAREEFVSKIILGDMAVEDGIEQYRSQYDAQVQECLTQMNADLNA